MAYATIADMRAEGVTDPPYDDPRVQATLDLATLLIDKLTGWWFEPRSLELYVDGRGHDVLFLGVPIIDVTKIEIGDGTTWTEIDLDDIEVYNRHISGQLHPVDDRYNPQIVREQSFLTPELPEQEIVSYWPKGTQNVRVTGSFGFTDPDGTATGKTPDLIKWACLRLAIKELPGMASDSWDEVHARSRIKTEKTRDQSITLGNALTLSGGALGTGRVMTGDPAIDAVLSLYAKPPAFWGV